MRNYGENGAPQAGFTECLNNLIQGKVAMWYDATSAAGSLEAADSPVRGKIGQPSIPMALKSTKIFFFHSSTCRRTPPRTSDE